MTEPVGFSLPDPTENVKALTEAAVQRLDDIAAIREHGAERLADVSRYYEDRLLEQTKELRKAESDRIDAIRAVDVGNVQRAAEVSAAQAEALRNTVAAAAAAAATALAAALDPIQKDIADLRRAQYEAQGKQGQVTEGRAASGAVVGLVGLGITLVLSLVTVISIFAANN